MKKNDNKTEANHPIQDAKLEELLHSVPRHSLPSHVHANIMQSVTQGKLSLDGQTVGSSIFSKTLAAMAVLSCIVLGSASVTVLFEKEKAPVHTVSDLPLLDECSLLEMM